MTTATIDNSDNGDILAAILWQYEHASNVVGVIEAMKAFYDSSTKDFFDALIGRYNLADENIGAFGLAVWGNILSLPRPYLSESLGMLSDGLYRKLLLGTLRLLNSDATMTSYSAFCDTVFEEGRVSVTDTHEMAIVFTAETGAALTDEETALLGMQDKLFPHPTGVLSNEHSASPMFGFDGQQPEESSDPNVGGLDDSGFCWRYTPNGNWID